MATPAVPIEDDGLFNKVNHRAVSYFRVASPEQFRLFPTIDEATRDTLRNVMGDAMAAGMSIKQVASEIAKVRNVSAEQALLIANTEIANAQSAGALKGYNEAVTNGVKLKKVWLASPDCCDTCRDNAAAGPIVIDKSFPSGNMTPLAHIGCRCALGCSLVD
jgi:hypothetical protein